MNTTKFNPSAELLSHTIDGWLVIEKLDMSNSTGGQFSCGYIAEDAKGEKVFLKALDFSIAFEDPTQQVDMLNYMTEAYIFERDLLRECSARKVNNVIRLMAFGAYNPDNNWPYAVNYLIMEKADRSAREILQLSAELDTLWALKSLHSIAVALNNLHAINVAHQDVKPSNVLYFSSDDKSKIGDVGRASSLNIESPNDIFDIAGDKLYSPFELRYGMSDIDWRRRRYSCDMFMFGNLIMTYFNGVSITTNTLKYLGEEFQPGLWCDDYSQVLPYIESAFYQVVDNFAPLPDDNLRNELMIMVTELCHPNPVVRGDSKEKGLQRFSLQRYISKLDYLYRKYEYKLRKGDL